MATNLKERSKIDKKSRYLFYMAFVVIVAVLVRIIAVVVIKTQPQSDFKTYYDAAKLFAEGKDFFVGGGILSGSALILAL